MITMRTTSPITLIMMTAWTTTMITWKMTSNQTDLIKMDTPIMTPLMIMMMIVTMIVMMMMMMMMMLLIHLM